MGLFKRKEERATGEVGFNEPLLKALLNPLAPTKDTALNIPSLNGCIEYIGNTIAMLPIKLYTEADGEVQEIKDDERIRLLNDDTGDTLDAVQFWKAMVRDYFLGKGAYAYINKVRNKFKSIHFVDEMSISVKKNQDPIFKDYDILINGKSYKPYDFIKLLRNSKDGASGTSLIHEAPLILNVGYNTLVFENNLVFKGGNKKGFMKSAKKLTDDAMTKLREAYSNLYSNNSENVVVLNDGLEFQEASNSSVEMQLNENKETNSGEICKLFNALEKIIKGTATQEEYINGFKIAVLPIIRVIECALNRDFLLEKEKNNKYWAFDVKEITKGDIKTRYEAYKVGIDANFLQPDEIRYMEDLAPLGLEFIKLGLDTVLYKPGTGEIYTPNTNQWQNMNKLKEGEINESGNQS